MKRTKDCGLQKGQTPTKLPITPHLCVFTWVMTWPEATPPPAWRLTDSLMTAEACRAEQPSPDCLLLQVCGRASFAPISVWHSSSSATRSCLRTVLTAAQKVAGVTLPTTMDIYTSRCRNMTCFMRDCTHPVHILFIPTHLRQKVTEQIRSRTARSRNGFYPEAVRMFYSGDAL